MTTPVFLTIDTEFAWRHHVAGHDLDTIYARSIEPVGVGITHQLRRLAEHGLKACFFVDPMPALVFGLAPIRRIVETVLAAGQEVQLHLHPNWTAARAGDGGAAHARCQMSDYSPAEQRDLIAGASELLVAAGAPTPIAFRAASYAANDATLTALADQNFVYDSSHNGGEKPMAGTIGLSPARISPVMRCGLIEVPLTVIEERAGTLRTMQVCALSSREFGAALDHAAASRHAAVTIISHGFELANRAGTRANAVHVRRFDAVCEHLAEMRDVLPTMHFADRPALALDRHDVPLGPHPLRTCWRQAEQLWSNWVEERVL